MRKVSIPPIRRPIHFPIRRPWIPYIILVISLIITILATAFVYRSAYEIDKIRFQSNVEQTQTNIANRIDTYIALLRGGSGLLASNAEITDEEFRLFVARLRITERYPGIQGIGYVERVIDSDKESFEIDARNEIDPDFNIFPDATREEYYPILFLEPMSYKEIDTTPGYDMFAEPTRRRAMQRARDTGLRAASEKVTLVQDGEQKQAGFIIYVPIYQGSSIPQTIQERREQIQGFIYSPFIADDVFTGMFGNQSQQQIHFQIYDGTKINKSTILYDSKTGAKQANDFSNPRFQKTSTIDIAGEKWTLTFVTNEQFESQSQRNITPFIFGFGLLMSGVLFLLSRSQYVARNSAERLASQLFQSQKELEKAIGMRDNFISIASHELRTPITSLKVYAEVLQRQFKKNKQTTSANHMAKMTQQIDKLSTLIMDLLDVTRIQSGKLALHEESFELGSVVKDTITNTQPLSEKHKIILRSSPKIFVLGDKDKIEQVLSNFLTNALKYSPDSDKVVVRVAKKANQAIVSVQDFGIGVDMPHQKRIFKRFYRVADKDEQTYPGLGIGLYICYEIIKRHHGEIQVASTKGKGSTFSFTLPLYKNVKRKSSA